MYRKLLLAGLTLAVSAALVAPAVAHVTVQPNEATKGSFSRFVVRVPNESDDASTTKITLEFPPLASVSFQPKEGWKRKVEMVELDEPLEAFGNQITEVVGSVTWSGGSIEPGEFDEFGFSALMPDETSDLEFPAHQTYDSGEVVDWVDAEDGEAPAAHVSVYDIGAGEGEGQLAVLAELSAASGGHTDTEDDDEDEDGGETAPLLLGGAGFVMGLAALALSLRKRT